MQQAQQNLQMQAQMEVDSFNSQMGFSVAQANQQAAAQKREELAQSARDISGFSQSPTDWGRLAAFETAGRVWGDEDQAIREEGGFITDKSLQPLAQGLDNRDRIIATPDNPFSFTPIQAPTFQPFELPQLPTPTIAPVATPEAAPAAARRCSRRCSRRRRGHACSVRGVGCGSSGEDATRWRGSGSLHRR
jgi:hypothetical protein